MSEVMVGNYSFGVRDLFIGLGVVTVVLLGLTGYFYTQGSLVPDAENWREVPTPDEETEFESVDGFVSAYTDANTDISESELREAFDFKANETGVYYREAG